MAWVTNTLAALDADTQWGAKPTTIRQVIASAGLSNTGLGKVRVTFRSGASGEGLSISSAYIGQAADSGDAYDFQATPVQLKFSGNNGFDIAVNSTITSDEAVFSIPTGKNIIVSFVVDDSAADNTRYKTSLSNYQYYLKASADEAATVNTSGYTTGANAVAISLVESSVLSSIKKVAGVAYASIKKISGVAIASVKKVSGIE